MEEKNQLQILLEKWANETAVAYHKLAKEDQICNRAFYTQSDLTKLNKSPELLVLGITDITANMITRLTLMAIKVKFRMKIGVSPMV